MKKLSALVGAMLVALLALAPLGAQRTATQATPPANATSATFSLEFANAMPTRILLNNAEQKFAGNIINFNLPSGNYAIQIEASGVTPIIGTLQVVIAGQTATVTLQNNAPRKVFATRSFPATTLTILPVTFDVASFNLNLNVTNARAAQVFNGNNLIGTAQNPITLNAGTYNLTIKAPGFADSNLSVNLNSNQNLSVTLTPLTAILSISVTNSKDAQITTNTGITFPAGAGASLPLGTYTLTIKAPGFQDQQLNVNLTGNQTLSVTLVPSTAILTVNVNTKDAQITTNTGMTFPAGAGASLPLGTYTLTVKAPGFQDQVLTVNLTANQTLNVTLQPQTGTVQINVPNNAAFQVQINGAARSGNVHILTPGTYQVRITIGGLVSETQVTVQAGRTNTITPALVLQVQ